MNFSINDLDKSYVRYYYEDRITEKTFDPITYVSDIIGVEKAFIAYATASKNKKRLYTFLADCIKRSLPIHKQEYPFDIYAVKSIKLIRNFKNIIELKKFNQSRPGCLYKKYPSLHSLIYRAIMLIRWIESKPNKYRIPKIDSEANLFFQEIYRNQKNMTIIKLETQITQLFLKNFKQREHQ